MGIEISERFSVDAPIDAVWCFVKDPEQLVTCMPGASLDDVVDPRTFDGTVTVKLGAVTSRYRGRAEMTEVDDDGHRLKVVAQGREAGGGTARGVLTNRLEARPGGGTDVIVEADLDLTGRVVQMGRGMIQGVSHELFKQFAASSRQRLEASPGEAGVAPPAAAEPIRAMPVLFRAVRSAIGRVLRRLRAVVLRKGGATDG